MEQAAFILKLTEEVKGLDSYLENDDYTNALADAERETGWSLPQTSDFRIYWLKARAKRHIFFYLMTESAHKFKYKQINLQQRFEHYREIIKEMDEAFIAAQEANPQEFANVAAYMMFGTKIDAGFQYVPQTGEDSTYTADNEVIFTPSEND
ncbi:hypothetical protein E2P64_06870 [Candidatus Bathyarchaeota archaeon]|nr:hypothetical protein E2P64_06870 [Candidatus Bathyarchaeota archaeon]